MPLLNIVATQTPKFAWVAHATSTTVVDIVFSIHAPVIGRSRVLMLFVPALRGPFVAAHSFPNSKHWFTTSFLQPLPYFVTPLGPENCQLTSSFLLVLKQK